MTRQQTTRASQSATAKRQETHSVATTVPEGIQEALRRVLDYLSDDECCDYKGRSESERRTHIWPHLDRLRDWLEK